MKKNLMNKMSLLLVLMLVAALALGCGKSAEPTTTTSTTTTDTVAEPAETESEEAVSTEADATEVVESTESVTEAVEGTEVIEFEQVGEGDTHFYFISTDGDGNSEYYEVSTDETTVGAALLELEMIEGEDSEYGLYVKTVNGVTADYDKDGTYWAFYIDGEYASTGVDSTDITDGATYSFVVEK